MPGADDFANHRTAAVVIAWDPSNPQHADAYDELMNAAVNAMVVPGVRVTARERAACAWGVVMLTPEALPVLAQITLERDRQLTELGWTPEHDDTHGAVHLVSLAVDHIIEVGYVAVRADDRDELVQAAALLVAAIEVLDRQAVR